MFLTCPLDIENIFKPGRQPFVFFSYLPLFFFFFFNDLMILFYDLFLSINFCSWCWDWLETVVNWGCWLAGWSLACLLHCWTEQNTAQHRVDRYIIYLLDEETTYFFLIAVRINLWSVRAFILQLWNKSGKFREKKKSNVYLAKYRLFFCNQFLKMFVFLLLWWLKVNEYFSLILEQEIYFIIYCL